MYDQTHEPYTKICDKTCICAQGENTGICFTLTYVKFHTLNAIFVASIGQITTVGWHHLYQTKLDQNQLVVAAKASL
jgi:hypothetical protein